MGNLLFLISICSFRKRYNRFRFIIADNRYRRMDFILQKKR